MRFIDKSPHRDMFDAYTRDYLHASENAQGNGFFPKLESESAYDNFSESRWKYRQLNPEIPYNGWLHVLMEEGADLCCYCMRRLSTRDISVEHLIPENFTGLNEDEELAFYEKYAPYLRQYVISGHQYDSLAAAGAVDIDTQIRMPHLVAHGNLFLACRSEVGCTCNNHRGNARVLPMMLMSDVDTWTGYTPDGEFMIFHPDIDAAKTIVEHLELNSFTLKSVRRLWFLFSRKGIRPQENTNYSVADKDAILRQAFDITGQETVIPDDFSKFIDEDEYYWKLLLKYDWFYDYYRIKYPVVDNG